MAEATRPSRLVVVLGTATEVGKTWVSAHLLALLRERGLTVAARKPAQSFAADDTGPTDAEVLALASGEEPNLVCPPHRWYPLAMAPPMASDALGRDKFHLTDLLRDMPPWPEDTAFGLIEAAGGPRSPLAHDGDGLALVEAVRPDHVVLVADAGLGTINAVRLCTASLDGIDPVVVLNRYDDGDDLHRRNRAWLKRDGVITVTSPETLADRLTR